MKMLEFWLKIHIINSIPALDQIMAWCHSGDKPLCEPMMVSLAMHICITWPQWVKKPCIYYIKHLAPTSMMYWDASKKPQSCTKPSIYHVTYGRRDILFLFHVTYLCCDQTVLIPPYDSMPVSHKQIILRGSTLASDSPGQLGISSKSICHNIHWNQYSRHFLHTLSFMMTSEHGKAFCINGHLWRESTIHWWIPIAKYKWYGSLTFYLLLACLRFLTSSCITCDTIVMAESQGT